MRIKWGNRTWETYKPRINRKKQASLLLLMGTDIILPLTFGIGFFAVKAITKFKPLWMYK